MTLHGSLCSMAEARRGFEYGRSSRGRLCNRAQPVLSARAYSGTAMKQQVVYHRGTCTMNIPTALALAFCGATVFAACTRDTQAMTAEQIEQQYGVAGAYAGSVATADGPVKGTLVPITLPNGRQGQLFIPLKQTDDPNTVYVRDEQGLHPVELKDQVSRDEVVRAPAIVVDKPASSTREEAVVGEGSADHRWQRRRGSGDRRVERREKGRRHRRGRRRCRRADLRPHDTGQEGEGILGRTSAAAWPRQRAKGR